MTRQGPSIAIIESLGDIGIGTYTYELAEGLVSAGCDVDVYALATSPIRDWARRHRFLADLPSVKPGTARVAAWSHRRLGPGALAASLARHRYDWVWTQWPSMMGNTLFWRYARAFQLPLVHTVHNVLPHEHRPHDRERMATVYRASRALIVHSDRAAAELVQTFPFAADRVIVQPHGAYTCCPPASARRDTIRARLGVPTDATVVLAFGWVRPYKNVESLVAAVADPGTPPVILLVAGRETGYDTRSPDPTDPLGRIRALAEEYGVSDRVRLIRGFLSAADASDLLSASDIVALPYVECWGSGQLLLAMTFGRYIAATAAGGMDEYLATYPAHSMIQSPAPHDVAAGIVDAVARLAGTRASDRELSPRFSWSNIARDVVAALEAGGGFAKVGDDHDHEGEAGVMTQRATNRRIDTL